MYVLTRLLQNFICIVLLLLSPLVAADTYLDELITRSKQLQLAHHPYWLKLVHYKANLLGGYSSDVLSHNFFNSPHGHNNPEAELESTLAAFFSNEKESDKKQNPQCRYIARYHWLNEQLKFDNKQLKPKQCKRYTDWHKSINPHQISMIFPAGTDNSPSSMFGHTLIRIDRKKQTERTRLFSYSINYAAETDETNGIIFAYKGIMGGYPGRFSIMPYYEKVNQYNQMENRDIWEYQLNFNKTEIDRLLRHAWETGQIDFAYYFFRENCSYRLLELFDIARPGMNSAANFDWYAIPGDTVYVALQEQGLLKKTIYRPSYRTRIKHALNHLDVTEQALILKLTNSEIATDSKALTTLNENKRAIILETSYDFLQYQHNSGAVERDKSAKTSYSLLKARSKLNKGSLLPPVPVPKTRLDQGHGSSRITLGLINDNHHDVIELRMRPAYHDLLDPLAGYTKGAQINFFDLSLRQDLDRKKTQLHSLRIIDIVSLVGRDDFFKPTSWKFNMGFERWPIKNNFENKMVFALSAGGGMTLSLSDSFKLFGLVDATILGHENFDDNLAAGIGPNLGAIWDISNNWRIMANSRQQHFDNHLDLTYVEHSLTQSFHWNLESSLRFKWQRRGPKQHTTDSIGLSWHWYLK